MKPARAALALLLLPLLTGCHPHSAANGLIPIKFQADWYPQPEHGGFYNAVVKGYYKQEGLDVTVLPGGPYINSEAQVASGQIQFGMQSSDRILEAISNADEPIVAVGATMQRDPQGILLHDSSPVHTWADLNGLTVAVRPGSTWWAFLVSRFHLDRVHEIPLTYSVANFVHDPNYIQQGFLTSEPFFAQKSGVRTRFLLNSDAGFNPYRVFFTSRSYLQAHPDIVARFTRASLRGWQDYMQDPGAANALIERLNPALSKEWATYSYNALKQGNFVTGDTPGQLGHFDPARWATLNDQLHTLGVLQHPLDPTTAYTTQFIP